MYLQGKERRKEKGYFENRYKGRALDTETKNQKKLKKLLDKP